MIVSLPLTFPLIARRVGNQIGPGVSFICVIIWRKGRIQNSLHLFLFDAAEQNGAEEKEENKKK